eukprot:s125_g30.t1
MLGVERSRVSIGTEGEFWVPNVGTRPGTRRISGREHAAWSSGCRAFVGRRGRGRGGVRSSGCRAFVGGRCRGRRWKGILEPNVRGRTQPWNVWEDAALDGWEREDVEIDGHGCEV